MQTGMQPIPQHAPPMPNPRAVWVLAQLVDGEVTITHNIAQGVSDPRKTADFLEHVAKRVREDVATASRSALILPPGVKP